MDPMVKSILKGAAAGFLASFVVDINAWSKSGEKFDWTLAIKRWISGAVSGSVAAMGLATV